MSKSYYEILGVGKSASADEIKSVYRKLAIKYHPDKNPDNPEATSLFMEITKAYNTLYDADKRKLYDQELTAPKKAKPSFKPGARGGAARNKFDLAEALNVFMKNVRRDQAFAAEKAYEPSRGSDIQISVVLSLMEVLTGCKKKIKLRHNTACTSCQGTGCSGGQKVLANCVTCNGMGKVLISGQEGTHSCQTCGGTGKVPQLPCSSCSGTGRTSAEDQVTVEFPAGIAEGNYLTISGMGEAGLRGGPAGDLIVFIKEKEDVRFRRIGYDLEVDVSVPLKTAVLGGSANLVDIRGEPQVFKINPGTQSETLFCLERKGLPVYRQRDVGNLYVKVHVDIPTNLSDDEKDAFEEFVRVCEISARSKANNEYGKYYLMEMDPAEAKNAYAGTISAAETLLVAKKALALRFEKIEYIDSLAIGKLVSLHRKMTAYGEKLTIVGATENIKMIFEDCGLDNAFVFVNKIEELDTGKSSLNEQGQPTNQSEGELGVDYTVKEINGSYIVFAGNQNCKREIFDSDETLALLSKQDSKVGIDLHAVDMVDSMVLGSWVRYYKELMKNGSKFFLYKPNDQVVQTLEATNLDNLFSIVNSLDELG